MGRAGSLLGNAANRMPPTLTARVNMYAGPPPASLERLAEEAGQGTKLPLYGTAQQAVQAVVLARKADRKLLRLAHSPPIALRCGPEPRLAVAGLADKALGWLPSRQL